MRWTWLVGAAWVAGCQVPTEEGERPRVASNGLLHAVGDSILAWFSEEGASIPDVVATERGQSVENAAVSSALMTVGQPELPSIPDQYVDEAWSWVIVDGGGNDLADRCDCARCDDVLDEIATLDGRGGVLPRFVGPVAASGVRVALMGYPELPAGAAFGLDACTEELGALADRMAAVASHDERIVFVDMRDIIAGSDTSMFDDDRVHPSRAGAAAMGRYLAERMAESEDR